MARWFCLRLLLAGLFFFEPLPQQRRPGSVSRQTSCLRRLTFTVRSLMINLGGKTVVGLLAWKLYLPLDLNLRPNPRTRIVTAVLRAARSDGGRRSLLLLRCFGLGPQNHVLTTDLGHLRAAGVAAVEGRLLLRCWPAAAAVPLR